MSLRKIVTRKKNITAALAAVAVLALAAPCLAVDMEMPSAAEVQYFSPEAQQFYAAGLAALDKADYANAYNMLSKAAILQPSATRLNHITATLAIYHGRQHNADQARDYYQTAVANYINILRVPTITADMRRQVQNELKLAQQEASQLPQRDAIREATGTTFILDYNRKYATNEPRKAGTLADASATTTPATQMMANPINQMMIMGNNPAYFEGATVGVDPYGAGAFNTGAGMQGGPGMPGAGMPGGPGMPGAGPGMPAAPGMPGPAGNGAQPPARY